MGGELVLTETSTEISEAALAGAGATFWVQNPDRLTALATASFILAHTSGVTSIADQARAIRQALAQF